MPKGIFAGQVPGGPAYTATKQGVVDFQAGQVPVTTPPYVSTVTTVVGDNINAAPAGPFYSATTIEKQQEAFGQLPVNKPPYVSTTGLTKTVAKPGISGTDNPNRLNEINGKPPVNTGMFEHLVGNPTYTATTPNS